MEDGGGGGTAVQAGPNGPENVSRLLCIIATLADTVRSQNHDLNFAYSTTLRRHHPEGPLGFPQTPHGAAFPNFDEIRNVVAEEGPAGLLQRTVQTVRSYFSSSDANDYERLPISQRQESRDTPSARFAHCSVDVSFTLHICWNCRLWPAVLTLRSRIP